MNDWQPIETAPRNGRTVLLIGDDGYRLMFWNGHNWDDGDFFSDFTDDDFTHWMPLPPPPKGDQA